MLDSFIYAINSVLPIFIIVALGYILMRFGFLGESFTVSAERLVFKVALPVMLFLEVSGADAENLFDGKFILFCSGGIIILFFALSLTVPLFIKENDKRGAFIQGIYRSNFAILGIPLAYNMFGEKGTQQIAMIMPFAITFFNVFAVIILSIYAPRDVKLSFSKLIVVILKSIVTNPLILSVIAALPFLFFKIPLPVIADKSLTYLSNMVMPVSLICIGVNFRFNDLRGRIGYALTASVFKVVIVPLIAVVLAVLLGFKNEQLGVILILFGGPTAVTSYIMAKNMKSDYKMAGQIIMLTTLLCIATIFIGVFILSTLLLI